MSWENLQAEIEEELSHRGVARNQQRHQGIHVYDLVERSPPSPDEQLIQLALRMRELVTVDYQGVERRRRFMRLMGLPIDS